MYAHYRLIGPLGKPLPQGGATVFYDIWPESKNPESCISITARVAVCSEKDHFCYALGREIAEGRYETRRDFLTWKENEQTTKADLHDLLDEYVFNAVKDSRLIKKGVLVRYSRSQSKRI